MDYSKGVKMAAKKDGMSIQEAAMADLVATGWSARDALLATSDTSMTWGEKFFRSKLESIENEPHFQLRVRATKAGLKKSDLETIEKQKEQEEDDLLADTSKEALLKDLVIAKRQAKIGTKEWMDAVTRIADITQAKKDEVKDEDTTVLFYMPLKCYNCSLYIKNQKDKVQKKE